MPINVADEFYVKRVESPTAICTLTAQSGVLRLRPLLLFPALKQLLSSLHDGWDVFALGPGQPHQSLSEKVLRPILVVRPVNFAEILGPVVSVVELENFLGGYDVVEVAENEEDGEVGVQFFEHRKVVDGKEVEAQLLAGPLFHQVQQGPQ